MLYAARSLADSPRRPDVHATTRQDAARAALRRAGRSYVKTWRIEPSTDGAERRDALQHHHPDDITN
jgi:hypothetical protein